MSIRYAVTRTIAAPPTTIWALLTDVESYPRWNPSVLSLEGTMRAGDRIKLVSTVNPKRTFTLRVAETQPPERLVWSDGMPLGLLSGTRTFTLRPQADGETAFSMVEEFNGPLAPLITRAIPDMTESFTMFADSLKKAAESSS